jgi:hypothetical protein
MTGQAAPTAQRAVGPPDLGAERPRDSRLPGAVRFARFAFAPNERGLCGPDAARTLFEHARDGIVDPELRALAADFEAAWPWLTLLAGQAGHDDPLDPEVVDAYWIGSRQIGSVAPRRMDDHLRTQFASRLRRHSPAAELLGRLPGTVFPVHHSSHVLRIMPLVGLARTGLPTELVDVMSRCLVRPGRVVTSAADGLTVESRALESGPLGLTLGPPRLERVAWKIDGRGFVDDVAPGELVAIHWGWAADRLTPAEAATLLDVTRGNLAAAALP